MADPFLSFPPVEEPVTACSTSHTYRAHLKQDGNRSYLHGDFHTKLRNISHEQYRKKKYTIGSARDMLREDFEEILRYFDKRTCQEVYEDCVHLLHDEEVEETVLSACRTNYHYTTLQRDFLIRFWLYHMGVEDHVVNAMLVRDGAEGGSISSAPRTLQNLTTLDATGVVGLRRVERFHQLLDEGVLGNRVGKHYLPKTKQGVVYWGENFTMTYRSVHTEPLRPVTTSALTRLLTERMHLLRLPSPSGSSESRISNSGGKRGNRGSIASRGLEVLSGVLQQVQLAPAVPVSAFMATVEGISPNYVAPTSSSHPSKTSLVAAKESRIYGEVEVEVEIEERTASGSKKLEVSPEGGGIESGSDNIISRDTSSDSDSDGDSSGDDDSGGGSDSGGKETAAGVTAGAVADAAAMSSESGGMGNESSSSCSSSSGNDSNDYGSIGSNGCGTKRKRSDGGEGASIEGEAEEGLYSSAKIQALENCLGRRFEGVADALLEMVFSFSESYADILAPGLDAADVKEDREDVDDDDDDADELEEEEGISGDKSLSGRAFETDRGAKVHDAEEERKRKRRERNRRKRERMREAEEGARCSEATLSWEHVLECAHTVAAETFAATTSHTVEVHPQLPQLQLTPALLRRVRSRATALFSASTKHVQCTPRARPRAEVRIRTRDKDRDSGQDLGAGTGGNEVELLPSVPTSILK